MIDSKLYQPEAAQESRARNLDEIKQRIKMAKSLSLMSKEETLRMRLEHVGPSVTLFFQENPLKIVQGAGQYLYDELGNEYLDCINNVAHVGHANKRVADAVGRQLGLLNTNSRFLHDNLSLFAKRLTAHFPKHLSVCYLVNSGSEANDLAIRLARAHTGKKDIVSLDGAYHGNLSSTMAISPYKTRKLLNFKQPKWAHVVPLPCSYRLPAAFAGSHAKQVGQLYAQAAEQVVESARARGRQVGALFVESMVSCGGQTPLPSGYLRHLQAYLKSIGALLVCDEVQTGFGRCGKKMWAFQLDGDDILPDIVTIGKPIGNGFPISAIVTTREIANSFNEIGTEYFNTFGGNAASCAAALAVLDELEERKLIREADKIGSFILSEMFRIKSKSRVLGDVRGSGLFIGLELVKNLTSKEVAPSYADFLVGRFRDERILMSTEGKFGNILKFKPPMVFQMEDARRFVRVFERALGELERQLEADEVAAAAAAPDGPAQRSTSCSSMSSAASSSSSSWLETSGEL